MANAVIGDYTAAITIDGANNFLLIQPGNSATAYKKISRNVLLGVTGQPADISSVQTVSNKILDNTNTITVRDGVFTLQDDVDLTKQARFQLSGNTTGTTRVYSLPNATGTLADLNTAQTFTNKTITTPAITGGTIDNSTITVDSISEHTASNGVTIAGMNIKTGKLNTNNSVVTANITDTAVTPAKLQSGTGAGWAWSSWTPTLTNLSGGTITEAKYIQTGKTVQYRFVYTLTGANVTGAVSFTPPVASVAYGGGALYPIVGTADLVQTGTTNYYGPVLWSTTTSFTIRVWRVTGTVYVDNANLSATIPFTWANTHVIAVYGTYEAA